MHKNIVGWRGKGKLFKISTSYDLTFYNFRKFSDKSYIELFCCPYFRPFLIAKDFEGFQRFHFLKERGPLFSPLFNICSSKWNDRKYLPIILHYFISFERTCVRRHVFLLSAYALIILLVCSSLNREFMVIFTTTGMGMLLMVHTLLQVLQFPHWGLMASFMEHNIIITRALSISSKHYQLHPTHLTGPLLPKGRFRHLLLPASHRVLWTQ